MSGSCARCGEHCLDCRCSLPDSIQDTWPKIQEDQRKDVSMRAFTVLMKKFVQYFDTKMRYFDCRRDIQEKMMDEMCKEPMNVQILNNLKDMGRAQERLKIILDDELFENLSKHNSYWQSEHEVEDDKLHTIRCKLSCMMDNLWDVFAILRREEA